MFIMVTLFIPVGQVILHKTEVTFGPKQCPYQGLTVSVIIISFQCKKGISICWSYLWIRDKQVI